MFSRAATEPADSLAHRPRARREDEEPERAPAPIERLEDELTELAAQINAGTCRWLELLAEFDRRDGWGQPGVRSCADSLSWRCAVSPSEAREHVRVAHKLCELPLIGAAFSRGELSDCKLRALTRIADERCEQELLELAALLTAAQLERALSAYRRVTSEQAREGHGAEFLSSFWDEDGSLRLRARLPAEEGALLVRALDVVVSMPIVVDLPAPFRPSRPNISPIATSKSMPLTARTPPGYVFVSRLTATAGR